MTELLRIHRLLEASVGEGHAWTLAILTNLGELQAGAGEYAAAEESLRKAVRLYQARSSDDWNHYRALALLGRTLWETDPSGEAGGHLREAIEGLQRLQSSIPSSHQGLLEETRRILK